MSTLVYCFDRGYAYDPAPSPIEYTQEYFDKYVGYEGSEIANALNAFRVSITHKYCDSLLDVGIGSGEFLKSCRVPCDGTDVNLVAVEWLRSRGVYADPYTEPWRWSGVTLWDVLEHFDEPDDFLSLVPPGVYVFVTIPCFVHLEDVERSKHYRPREHLHHWTRDGFVMWMADRGFRLVEESDEEVRAGREEVRSFVFVSERLISRKKIQ